MNLEEHWHPKPKGSALIGLTVIAVVITLVYESIPCVTFRPVEGGMYRITSSWWGLQKKTNYLKFYGGSWHIAMGKTWRDYSCNEDTDDDRDYVTLNEN